MRQGKVAGNFPIDPQRWDSIVPGRDHDPCRVSLEKPSNGRSCQLAHPDAGVVTFLNWTEARDDSGPVGVKGSCDGMDR